MMIYIVEDDKNIQEIESFALKNSGYEVRGFEYAKDFYAALDEQIPDLVLLDIMLPDEDGLQILKKLRLNHKTVLVPVIMVTAKTTELDKVKGLDLGADDYQTVRCDGADFQGESITAKKCFYPEKRRV